MHILQNHWSPTTYHKFPTLLQLTTSGTANAKLANPGTDVEKPPDLVFFPDSLTNMVQVKAGAPGTDVSRIPEEQTEVIKKQLEKVEIELEKAETRNKEKVEMPVIRDIGASPTTDRLNNIESFDSEEEIVKAKFVDSEEELEHLEELVLDRIPEADNNIESFDSEEKAESFEYPEHLNSLQGTARVGSEETSASSCDEILRGNKDSGYLGCQNRTKSACLCAAFTGPACPHGDGATANPAPCVCGNTACTSSTGLFCNAGSCSTKASTVGGFTEHPADVCKPLTPCAAGEYDNRNVSINGTATQDRECTNCADIPNKASGASVTCSSDSTSRLDGNCAAGYWKDSSGDADVCKLLTPPCNANQFQSTDPTAMQDRGCTNCANIPNKANNASVTCTSDSTSRLVGANNSRLDGNCAAGFWKDSSGAADVCKQLTSCTAGEYDANNVLTDGTATQDRNCVETASSTSPSIDNAFTVYENTHCDGTFWADHRKFWTDHRGVYYGGTNAWIVPRSSEHWPSNCRGYSVKPRGGGGKCRYTANNTPADVCKELCLNDPHCSGFVQTNAGACYFRHTKYFNEPLRKKATPGSTCYEKKSTGRCSTTWYCAVSVKDRVTTVTPNLEEAQRALGISNRGRPGCIIPMTHGEGDDPGDLRKRGWRDPHQIPKTWHGGAMWWNGWGHINQCRALCAQATPPSDICDSASATRLVRDATDETVTGGNMWGTREYRHNSYNKTVGINVEGTVPTAAVRLHSEPAEHYSLREQPRFFSPVPNSATPDDSAAPQSDSFWNQNMY